jgi:hypothetical protein
MKKDKAFTSSDFRAELKKYMPGFKWTVSRQRISKDFFDATGIQSAGFNRTGTMKVERTDNSKMKYGGITYMVKVAGYGKNTPWLCRGTGSTIRQALRDVQETCEYHASKYESVANTIESARKAK